MKGYVLLWRSLFHRDDWLMPSPSDPACNGYAFMYLIQLAQWEEYRHGGERLNRGEFITSARQLAKDMCWSKSRASRFLSRLKCGTMIGTVRETPRGTVYVITNYDTYQDPDNVQRDTQRDMLRDTSGTRAGQEQRSKKENNSIRGPKSDPKTDAVWSQIREVYPQRSGSQGWTAAEKSFRKLCANGSTPDQLLDKVRRYADYVEAEGDVGTKYVMQAASFFGPQKAGYREDWAPTRSKAKPQGLGGTTLRSQIEGR